MSNAIRMRHAIGLLFFVFQMLGLLSLLDAQGWSFTTDPDLQRVSTPVIVVNGKKITGEADISGKDIISVSVRNDEKLVLNFSYFLRGVRKNSRDIRLGLVKRHEAKNINIGAFKNAPKGTVWIVSFFALRDDERGETVVAVFTKTD